MRVFYCYARARGCGVLRGPGVMRSHDVRGDVSELRAGLHRASVARAMAALLEDPDWMDLGEQLTYAYTAVPDPTAVRTLIRHCDVLVEGPCLDVCVVNEDTLFVASGLINSGLRPAVLNMANGRCPGGGFHNGALGQEEELCRRSSLYAALRCADAAGLYPLLDTDVLVTENVHFMRSVGPNYPWLQVREAATVLTCAAAPCSIAKIQLLLTAAVLHGHTALVLGAMGCGSERDGAHVTGVARQFAAVLKHHGASFTKVVFAILGDSCRLFTDALCSKE